MYTVAEFGTYARMWIPLVERFGGVHHGYYLPHESDSGLAVASSVFRRWPSMKCIEWQRRPILTVGRRMLSLSKQGASLVASVIFSAPCNRLTRICDPDGRSELEPQAAAGNEWCR